jgi:predicted AAA+ superfamily ATPase
MERAYSLRRLDRLFRATSVVAILGPRQCGKTTLARHYSKGRAAYFDLENPRDVQRLDEPFLALEGLEGLVVIDEIQRSPGLFKALRVLVDRPKNKARYLILGRASRDLIRQGSETLAGRVSFMELSPFSLSEVGSGGWKRLWERGGFPTSFLARSSQQSRDWRDAYITTFLEQDIPLLGFQIPPRTLRRFWMMLTFYHGQIFNASEIGRSLGVAHTTVQRYLDILNGTFMVRVLLPWVENINKRLVKSPKIYFRDSGLLLSMLGLESLTALQQHPKLGAAWEGFALEEVVRRHGALEEEVFFWATHGEAELDLLVFQGGHRWGYEFKYADAPRITRSMTNAIADLRLDHLTVVFPGKDSYKLSPTVTATGLTVLPETLGPKKD